jgi:hypothetical protein
MPLSRSIARWPPRKPRPGVAARPARAPVHDVAALTAALPSQQNREGGQALVLVALFLSAMLAFAALGIDVGRFMAERRFLQNAADAAALAAANKMISGGSVLDAEAAARASLTLNFANDPTGRPPALPSTLPVYAPGHAGEAAYLTDGIVVTSSEAFVAVGTPVEYTFGRVVGAVDQQISAQARAGYTGKLLPISVQRYLNAPGSGSGTAPCVDLLGQFTDVFATEVTACLGDVGDPGPRVLPSTGGTYDPTFPADPVTNPPCHPDYQGPNIPILGQGSQPAGTSDFRGFVALDVRNFASVGSQLYYNGVTPGANAETLKGIQGGYVGAGGYPGPDFPVVVAPPDPNLQVAALSGNSTRHAVGAMRARYHAGDLVLVTVYGGTVMRIAEFAISAPGLVAVPETGVTASVGSVKAYRNQSFSGDVTLSTLADTLDPAHPMNLNSIAAQDPIAYAPNPVTPTLGGTTVLMENLATQSASPGIYTMWIKAEAGSHYLPPKYQPFPLQVGTVATDFRITSDTSLAQVPSAGLSASFRLTLQNAPNGNTNFGGPVALSADPGSIPGGQITLSSANVTPTKAGARSTLTIDTTGVPAGVHSLVVRATGYNGEPTPRKVTHLLPLTLSVGTGTSGSDYVDIVGFAVMRIAATDDNTVWACAVTQVHADMNDPALRVGREPRLLPW